MNLKTLLLFTFLLISTAVFSEVDTWGPTGHRATGEIAEKHLSRKAKRKIKKLLEGQSLAFVSTYADQIKSDKKYNKYYSWHYVNMPLNGDYVTAEKNPKGDLVTGINYCIKTLKDKKSSLEDKQFSLKMLVHLVGDLHQPLHIGRKEDKGGNTIQVQWHGKGSNLHRVWDENLISQWNMSYIELASNAKKLTKKEVKKLQSGSVLDWVKDSHKLTKEIYSHTKTGDKLRYKYSYRFFPVVRQQLQKGGLRLAKLLNEIFD